MSVSYEASIEGLLFVAGANGISLQDLAYALNLEATACLQQIERLKEKYENDPLRGLTILFLGGHYKLVTKNNLKKTIENYAKTPGVAKLSQAAIETLAIIAYKQPISRGEVDEIRGVQSHGAVQTLVMKRLIEEKGRFNGPGRAILYGTTNYFLDYFGLEDLEKLPDLMELEDKEDQEIPSLFHREKKDNFFTENDSLKTDGGQ